MGAMAERVTGGPGKAAASSAGNLFFLLPPCFPHDRVQFLLLNTTVEHKVVGLRHPPRHLAPSSPAADTGPGSPRAPAATPPLSQPSPGLVAPPVPPKSCDRSRRR